jgi:hypothetical protein
MGVGTLVALMRERGVVERNQKAQSLLDISTRDFQSPLERVGLSRGDWRMRLEPISKLPTAVDPL